jgi:hypothetical protein
MFTVERKVGRLVEVMMRGRVTLEELDSADRGMAQARRESGAPLVIIADYRQTKFLLEEHASYLAQMFRRHNDSIERSAVLVSATSAIGVLQMERVIREAKHPSRRAFRDPNEAASWLDEVLTPIERARVRVALAQGTQKTTTDAS